MDPEPSDDILNHLEKQHELLIEAHRSMTQELQKAEVEEEIMMRKLYELMSTLRANHKEKEKNENVAQSKEMMQVEASSSSSSN